MPAPGPAAADRLRAWSCIRAKVFDGSLPVNITPNNSRIGMAL